MYLGDIVRRIDGQRNELDLCQVRSMLNEPSAELVGEKGHTLHWAQSLTRPATPDEILMYWMMQAEMWKKRAEQHGCNVASGDADCG